CHSLSVLKQNFHFYNFIFSLIYIIIQYIKNEFILLAKIENRLEQFKIEIC
ncbi:unnamed protein product, partial [Brugia timori]|uniref:ATP-binding protein n=1 Tax=Brugia timori TaxID=42155 RepID=A0A0R3RAI3_9BILA